MSNKSRAEADLHCHTTASDGLLTPGEVVKLAYSKGLKAVGITDHDTIDGWEEAEKTAEKVPIKIVKGIEINTDWQGREIHILGYLLEKHSAAFSERIKELQQKRTERIRNILDKLHSLNIDIEFDEVRYFVKGESMGRPHVAQAMVKKGYTADFREAFDNYLRVGAPAYVPRYKLTPTQAIRIIREAGGVAVLAHPGSQNIEKDIEGWVQEGLQGIEVYHPEHSSGESVRYGILAERLGLISTGGSDFHGDSIKTGIDIGDWGVDMEVVDLLEREKNKVDVSIIY